MPPQGWEPTGIVVTTVSEDVEMTEVVLLLISATLNPGQTQEFIVFGICPKTSGSSFSDTITVTYTEPSQPIPGPYSLSGTAKGTSTTPAYNTFTAYNLPGNVPWTVVYAGMNQTTSASSMTFVSLSNSAWQIYPVTVNGVTYYPIYAAGSNISAGYNLEVDFIPMRNLWLSNYGANNVSMIYYNNNTLATKNGLTGLVAIGSLPVAAAVTPNGQYFYVSIGNGASVSVISTSLAISSPSSSVIATIPVGSYPNGVAITPNGQYVYVADINSNTTSVISTSSNSVVATIHSGYSPHGVAITPNGQYVYVVDTGSNSVSVISTSSNSVIATTPVGSNPTGIAITPNGQYVYVTNYNSNTTSVISTSSDTVVTTIPVGSHPWGGIAITPNGQYVYVTNRGSNTVSVISTSSNSVIATIPVGSGPDGITITPNGQYAYVLDVSSNSVSVVSTSSNSVVTTITGTPSTPCGINYGPIGNYC